MDAAEREAIVRRGVEAWNAGDWSRLEAMHAPEAEVIAPVGWPESGSFCGWEAIRHQYERLKDSWSWERIELEGLESGGELVVARTRWVAHGQASGIDLDQELWIVYEFDGERVSRLRYFLEEEPAREAASA